MMNLSSVLYRLIALRFTHRLPRTSAKYPAWRQHRPVALVDLLELTFSAEDEGSNQPVKVVI